MIKEVYEFNKIRNKFVMDSELEEKMFNEEVTEFFDATSLAMRVDAYVDCEYVIIGTELKSIKHNVENPNTKLWSRTEPIFRGILTEEFNAIGLHIDEVLEKARVIVCAANAIKGKELVDGKVSKSGFNVPVTKQIEDMIKKLKDK